LLNAVTDLSDEILFISRGDENFHLVLDELETLLIEGDNLSLLKIFHDVGFHSCEVIDKFLTSAIGQRVHRALLNNRWFVDWELDDMIRLHPLNWIMMICINNKRSL